MKLFTVLSFIVASGLMILQGCGMQPKPEKSCNFVMNSFNQRVSWAPSVPVVLYVHESVPTDAIPTIQDAMDKWNTRFGRNLLVLGTGVVSGENRPVRDGRNVIYWMLNWDEALRFREQARTTILWSDKNLFEADMMINANQPLDWSDIPSIGKIDLESLMVHELGHVMGLAHVEGKGTVMARELNTGILRREPQEIDLQSLSCEY